MNAKDATTAPNASVTAKVDLAKGEISATALLAGSPERVFHALTSIEICKWWVNPGVFDTREWKGDLRPGGHWEASGIGGGRPYRLEGEYLEIEAPHKLVHTWKSVGAPGGTTTVTYRVEPAGDGVRLTLAHTGLMAPEMCERTRAGWETSFVRLAEILDAERAAAS